MVGSLFGALPFGDAIWYQGPDVWKSVNSAQWISHGALGTVYQANSSVLTLPGFQILLTPFVVLGDHLNLSVGYPFQIPHPTMWLLIGPVFSLVGASSIVGVDALAQEMGAGVRRRQLIAVLMGAFIVIPTVVMVGHPEDLAALALSCYTFIMVRRGRSGSGAWLLGLAVLFQLWAGLLIPLFLVASPAASLVRNLLRSAGPASVLAGTLLALDWPNASRSLLEQPMVPGGQRLPWWYLGRRLTIDFQGHVYHAIAGSSIRSLASAGALILAIVFWRRPSERNLLVGFVVACLCRGLFDGELWSFYLAPPAALIMVLGATAKNRATFVALCAAAVALVASCGQAYAGISLPTGPYFEGLLVVGVGAVWLGWRDSTLRGPAVHTAYATELVFSQISS
jgi:hypothetical protein